MVNHHEPSTITHHDRCDVQRSPVAGVVRLRPEALGERVQNLRTDTWGCAQCAGGIPKVVAGIPLVNAQSVVIIVVKSG